MISARLALAAVVGSQLAMAVVALAAEPQRQTVPAPPIPERKPELASSVGSGESMSHARPVPAPVFGQAPQVIAAESEAWTPAAIAEAKARCAAALKGLDVTVIPEEPIKDGGCGAAAPVTLVRLGKSPEVVLSPPVMVTCDMVAQLDKWLRNDVQPLARKLLGAPVVKIETMSSYSCRNAYGRVKTRLSEHGRANALDIGGFLTANAEPARVLASWGPTGRDIAARALAAAEATRRKAEADRAAAEHAAVAQPATPEPAGPEASGAVNADWTASIATQIKGMLGFAAGHTGASPAEQGTALGLTASSRLGGPRANAPAAPTPSSGPDPEARRSQFLRQAHAAACKYFGTVLGPEANEAHRNHLHVDLAERQRSSFCE
jgi:hypothetical protein